MYPNSTRKGGPPSRAKRIFLHGPKRAEGWCDVGRLSGVGIQDVMEHEARVAYASLTGSMSLSSALNTRAGTILADSCYL